MKDKVKNILVTGGAGYIGSVLVNRLVDAGFKVSVVDDLSSGSRENINKKVKFYKTSILSPELEKIIKKEKPDMIYHLAALKSVDESLKKPLKFAEVNILGSLNLLNIAAKYSINKVVFMSTAGVYGELMFRKSGQVEDQKLNPSSPYAASKLAIENYISYYNTQGMKGIVLRFANVYGRGGKSLVYGVVDKFIEEIIKTKKITVNGNGKQTRDFINIHDLVDLCFQIAKNYPKTSSNNFIFNVSTGKETSVNKLIEEIKKIYQIKFQVAYDKKGNVGQLKSLLDPSLAKKLLGWKAKTNLSNGIKNIKDSTTK